MQLIYGPTKLLFHLVDVSATIVLLRKSQNGLFANEMSDLSSGGRFYKQYLPIFLNLQV